MITNVIQYINSYIGGTLIYMRVKILNTGTESNPLVETTMFCHSITLELKVRDCPQW